MRIIGPGQPRSLDPVRRTGRKRDAAPAFKVEAELTPLPTAGMAQAQPLAPVDALLSIQEIGERDAHEKRALRRGHDLLNHLDDIRHGLLTGTISTTRLDALARRLKGLRPDIADPRLAEIAAEIELRAAVELAKLNKVKG